MKRNFSVRMDETSIGQLKEVAEHHHTTANRLIEAAVGFYIKAINANNDRLPTPQDEVGFLSLLSTKSSQESWSDFWKVAKIITESEETHHPKEDRKLDAAASGAGGAPKVVDPRTSATIPPKTQVTTRKSTG